MTMQRPRLYPPPGPLVIGFANEGGGTRKTGTCVNLAVELASRGISTAVLDGDQTMAASCYLGYGVTNKKYNPLRVRAVHEKLDSMTNIYDVLHGRATLLEASVPARTRTVPFQRWDKLVDDEDSSFAEIPNLRLILGSRSMGQASNDLKSHLLGSPDEQWLRRAIVEMPPGAVEVIMVDFRGTFDTLEYSEVAACDFVVGCVKPDQKDDDTLSTLIDFIDEAQKRYQFSGGAADLRYVMLNGIKRGQGNHWVEMEEEIIGFYGDRVLPTITEAVQIAESVRAQEPVLYWCDPASRPVKEFKAAADVFEKLVRAA
ncbi:ParA family protein [Kitasatospora sp. NPDC002227]|uniref:ParA family protein n=1 Tax=Kitasatospora sp. NPDC002227 TaxID=3154773 RepID=UPI00331C51F2